MSFKWDSQAQLFQATPPPQESAQTPVSNQTKPNVDSFDLVNKSKSTVNKVSCPIKTSTTRTDPDTCVIRNQPRESCFSGDSSCGISSNALVKMINMPIRGNTGETVDNKKDNQKSSMSDAGSGPEDSRFYNTQR